ncbi:hypothetical protein RJ639_032003 [Escallonia herrerae]|uniref:Receptor-like serine/threonine-protein kinase n=1 Tax=Escallonia herrerae TaxID=1293975 RepID=A0AA89BCA7_9ASTE|nr:hypothetical protein RJ639_032003 [Escallonia herrerae]
MYKQLRFCVCRQVDARFVAMALFVILQHLGYMYLSVSAAPLRMVGRTYPGFSGSLVTWIDSAGKFLFSNNLNFVLGFSPTTEDPKLLLLVVIHVPTTTTVWTANRGSMVRQTDNFVFDRTGNMCLEKEGGIAWSTDTAGKGVAAMELQDSGNLVLLNDDSKPIWQSFSYPTDTLLSNQFFFEGMRLVSEPNLYNLSFYLEMSFDNLMLFGGFETPQPYWFSSTDVRFFRQGNGVISSASIISNSWSFFDQNQTLVAQLIFSADDSSDACWAAVLGANGLITFHNLHESSTVAVPEKIPQEECATPEPCGPYGICEEDKGCRCLDGSNAQSGCNPGVASSCNGSKSSVKLLDVGSEYSYFSLSYTSPIPIYDLVGCMDACLLNCSCLVLFYENSSRNCFHFEQIGSLQKHNSTHRFLSYIKVSSTEDPERNHGKKKRKKPNHLLLFVVIATTVLFFVSGLFYLGFWCHKKRKRELKYLQEVVGEDAVEDNNVLDKLSCMCIRFSYKDLQTATNNFSMKLGQGGFGSVYEGVLTDGTRIAVKKLEGFSQGKREFEAEVHTIGSIHHRHLVKLKGFCVEGIYRLLAYEYVGNGSLEKWIFREDGEGETLDWQTRFNIALGLAKGLAYLHKDCGVKIVHCDVKPENVLLDDNFQAKVSDFGLARLMTREQSRVVTMFKGTRGYLAPEWITNHTLSEKCDVYSFGMVLLEIIGGRRNFSLADDSEKAIFPSYALKMMEEGRPEEILDSKLKIITGDESLHVAVIVALYCIQGDMSLRPSMGKVVKILEGSSMVPEIPSSSQMMSNFFAVFVKPTRRIGITPGVSYCHSDAELSGVQLSGPR